MRLHKSSLFWKIFLSFWLANILVLFSATYFTLQSNESSQHELRRQQIASHLGELFIPALQRGEVAPRFKPKRGKKHSKQKLRITDKAGTVLFDNLKLKKHTPKNNKPRKPLIFDRYPFTAEDGREYFIELPANRAKLILMKHLHKMLVFRLLLILFFSGLVSYFLTRFITRPLKVLGESSRAYSKYDFDQQQAHDLLERPDEIGDLARDINRMQQDLTQLIDDKQNLLHDVSHELRAPLARLMAATALLEGAHSEQAPLLQRLDSECENMAGLIDSILNFSRLSEMQISSQSFDVTQLLQQCIEDCQFEFPEIRLVLNSPEMLPMHSDAALLIMAIMNILRNACLHSGTTAPITIHVKQQHHDLILCIEDKGKGLSAEQLQQLFTPFHSDANSTGFGLGMSISKRAVEKLSGTLTAKNISTGGLAVSLQLPITVI